MIIDVTFNTPLVKIEQMNATKCANEFIKAVSDDRPVVDHAINNLKALKAKELEKAIIDHRGYCNHYDIKDMAKGWEDNNFRNRLEREFEGGRYSPSDCAAFVADKSPAPFLNHAISKLNDRAKWEKEITKPIKDIDPSLQLKEFEKAF